MADDKPEWVVPDTDEYWFTWSVSEGIKAPRIILVDLSEQNDELPEKSEKQENNMSEERKVNFSQWLNRGGNVFIPTDNSATQKELDPAVYNLRMAEGIGYYMFKKDLNLDEIVDLPMEEATEVLEGIETFWKRKEKYAEYGFTFKRGVLLYGNPGNGKSVLINKLAKLLLEGFKGIVLYITSAAELDHYYKFSSEILRIIEPERKLFVVMEDIDGIVSYKENETTLLNILDGVNQLDNVVYLATTNYPEKLSARITNRPSRFDLRVEIKAPNEECRRIYFKAKLKPADLEQIDLEKWVRETDGLSMAHLGEVIKSAIIIGNDFDKTIQALKGMKELPCSADFDKDTKRNVGFISPGWGKAASA
jgi:ATP-dependent 26S proteasome regulatory subunit